MAGPDASSSLHAYVDELVESATVLSSLEDAATGEAFASGAVAEWLALGGGSLVAALDDDAGVLSRLVAWIEQGERPRSRADDPDWLDDVGTSRIVAATRLADPDEPAEVAYVIHYETASRLGHDVAVTLVDDRLVDIAIGAPGLAEAIDSDAASGFAIEATEAEAVAAVLAARLGSADPTELGDRARLDLPLLCRRFDLAPDSLPWAKAAPGEPAVDLIRDPDDDRYAAELLDSVLRRGAEEPAPATVEQAAAGFGRLLDAGDPDALALMTVAGQSSTAGELDALLGAVGAYLAPVDLSPHAPDEHVPIASLEPADWVGVILGLLRGAEPPPLDGATCVRLINRCPEITTTIPKKEAPLVAWAFDRVLYAWERTGVLDEDGALTEAGRWLLPRAAWRAWQAG